MPWKTCVTYKHPCLGLTREPFISTVYLFSTKESMTGYTLTHCVDFGFIVLLAMAQIPYRRDRMLFVLIWKARVKWAGKEIA